MEPDAYHDSYEHQESSLGDSSDMIQYPSTQPNDNLRSHVTIQVDQFSPPEMVLFDNYGVSKWRESFAAFSASINGLSKLVTRMMMMMTVCVVLMFSCVCVTVQITRLVGDDNVWITELQRLETTPIVQLQTRIPHSPVVQLYLKFVKSMDTTPHGGDGRTLRPKLSMVQKRQLKRLIVSQKQGEFSTMQLRQLKQLYKQWMEVFVGDRIKNSEVRSITGDTPGASGARYSFQMQLFAELSRMNVLLMKHKVAEQKRELETYTNAEYAKYMVKWSLSCAEHAFWKEVARGKFAQIWMKPVFKYTQREVMSMVQFISSALNDLPSCDMHLNDDLKMLWECLYYRNGKFLLKTKSENVLDVPEMRLRINTPAHLHSQIGQCIWYINRDYLMFCTAYFGEWQYRIYYIKLYGKKNRLRGYATPRGKRVIQQMTSRCTRWCKALCSEVVPESVRQLYGKELSPIAYRFPGKDKRAFSWKGNMCVCVCMYVLVNIY